MLESFRNNYVTYEKVTIMSRRMKIKLHNFRIYLRKYVFNSKYIVRNTLAMIIMATFVVSIYGLTEVVREVQKSKPVTEPTATVTDMYAEAEDDLLSPVETVSVAAVDAPQMRADLTYAVMDSINDNTEMGVEANDLQLVAEVASTEETTEEPTMVEQASINKKPATTEEPATTAPTTQAPTTQTPTTQAPTTQAPTTQTPTTQAPTTTEAVAETPSNPTTVGTSNRGAVSLSDDDIYLMAAVMTLECGGESYEGQLAVANVIITRYLSGYYGSTISDVVYAPYQFSVVSTSQFASALASPQESCIQAAREAASGVNNVGSFTCFRPTWYIDEADFESYTIIGNHIFF
ncbi:MAG: cell wall hydrolase [Lachnospiraceae bacterium]|nr:cell wall hydrolase [Lachnospiraceae bacterium]